MDIRQLEAGTPEGVLVDPARGVQSILGTDCEEVGVLHVGEARILDKTMADILGWEADRVHPDRSSDPVEEVLHGGQEVRPGEGVGVRQGAPQAHPGRDVESWLNPKILVCGETLCAVGLTETEPL